jgi:TolB protein
MFRERVSSRPGSPMYRCRALCLVAAALIAVDAAASANQLLQQPVIRTYQPVRIALLDFAAAGPSEAEPAHAIWQIVVSDLRQSRAFAPIDPTAFVEKNVDADGIPKFADWREISTEEIVVGRVTRQPDSRIKVEFRLWDVPTGRYMMGQQYVGIPDDFNRIGHMISEAVYERATGKKRAFD